MAEDTRSSGFSGGPSQHEGARIVGAAHHDDATGPGPDVMAASTFDGETIVNPAGETLGEVEEIMLDVRSGRIAYVVLAAGGFLGVGDKYFAIPWRALTLDTDRKVFILDVDKERLQQAPGFDKDCWPAMADQRWAGEVHDYYGTPVYWE